MKQKSLDKFKGCLFGGAVGDAFGYAVEFLNIEQIREVYGGAGITQMQLEDGVAQARAHLDSNPDHSDHAALVYDGYITLSTGRTDALFVVIRSYATPAATLTMAVPYRNAESSDGFAVHRPKFLDWQGKSDPDYQALGAAFFRGVDAHDEASVVWAEHSDDSI